MFQLSDLYFKRVTQSLALTGIVVLVGIVIFLAAESTTVLLDYGASRFVVSESWHPLEGQYNILPMISGSLFITLGAVIIALPLSLGAAILISAFLPYTLKQTATRILEVFSGIPSVVYGLWGMVVIVPFIASIEGPGTSLLAGSIVVAMMIIPALVIMFNSRLDEQIQTHYFQARSLGLTRPTIIGRIILPTASPDLLRALILQTARAIGETMAVLMVCGNVVQHPDSIFAPVRTLTTNTALEMAYATGSHRSALFLSGLILLVLVGVLLLSVRFIDQRRMHYA